MASAGVNYICYVRGLCAKSDDRSVEVAFDQYGEIVRIQFQFDMKDPETQIPLFYAFVTFKDEKSVDDAIEGMNGQDLDGWPITVTKHDPRGGGGGGYSCGGRRNAGGKRGGYGASYGGYC